MKKLLYLFIIITSLCACESNEDENASSSDPIIGKWQLTSEIENGIEISTECERKSTITFQENKTVSQTYYYKGDNNNCVSESDSANWENLGSSNYKLTYSDNENSTSKVNFSQDNSVFTITSTDNYSGTTYTYISTYKKV